MWSNERAIEKSKLDYYLDEEPLSSTTCTKFDVLDFWKVNAARFPYLSKMACDVLSIPISTVASESAFSIGSQNIEVVFSQKMLKLLFVHEIGYLVFHGMVILSFNSYILLNLFVLIIYIFSVCIWQMTLRPRKRKLLLFHFFQVQRTLLLHLQIPIEEWMISQLDHGCCSFNHFSWMLFI